MAGAGGGVVWRALGGAWRGGRWKGHGVAALEGAWGRGGFPVLSRSASAPLPTPLPPRPPRTRQVHSERATTVTLGMILKEQTSLIRKVGPGHQEMGDGHGGVSVGPGHAWMEENGIAGTQ